MKYLIAVTLLFLVAIHCSAQQLTYAQWQKEAEEDFRMLPKYGGAKKTPEQLGLDSAFIKTAIEELESPRKASDYMVRLGFDFLAKGDPKQASYRFNQAWLIDPTNENVFWGFGGIYFIFKDHEKALQQYTEGLVLNPKSATIMTDMAAIGMARYQTNKEENELTASINLLKLAYDIDPTYQTMLTKLAICYYLTNDCANAIKYHDQCKKLGGKMISESFTKALQEKCKN